MSASMNFGKKIVGMTEYTPFLYTQSMVRLDANESYADMPDELKQKVAAEIQNVAFNRYPDPYSTALCKAFADCHGLYAMNVLAGNGSDELISIVFSSLLSKYSTVLLTSPDFSMYKFYADLYEKSTIVVNKNKEENLNFSADDIIDAAKRQNPDLIMFSNPCNPTGQSISAEEVEKIIKNVSCMVCVDEAYMDFWTKNETVMPLINKYDNLMVFRTCSKAFGLAAFRIGFVVASEKIITMFRKAKMPYNLNALSQAAGLVALKNRDYIKNITSQIISRKEGLYENLKNFDCDGFRVYDTKTNFIVCRSKSAKEIYEFLQKCQIIVRFIQPDLLRITAGTRGENELLKNKLEAALHETRIYQS